MSSSKLILGAASGGAEEAEVLDVEDVSQSRSRFTAAIYF